MQTRHPLAHMETCGRRTRIPQREPHKRGGCTHPDVSPRRDPGPESPSSSRQHCNEMTVSEAPLQAEDSGVALGVEAPGARPARAGLRPRGRWGLGELRAGPSRGRRSLLHGAQRRSAGLGAGHKSGLAVPGSLTPPGPGRLSPSGLRAVRRRFRPLRALRSGPLVQWAGTCLAPCGSVLISIRTNQSELFSSDQSECPVPTSQRCMSLETSFA